MTTLLPALGALYASHRNLALSTVGRLVAGHGSFFQRVSEGRVTLRRAAQAVQWLSDHWPSDLSWPDDIPRPEPAAGGPAEPPAAPLTRTARRRAVLDARSRMREAADRSAWDAAKIHERAMFEAALALRGDGKIADPEALCEALQVPRFVYDDVVRRYSRGRRNASRVPRRGSRVARMLQALRSAGDVRFASAGWGEASAAARTVREAAS